MPPPEREYRNQRLAYDRYLSGKSARTTFDSIGQFFASEQNRTGSTLNQTISG